MSTDYRTLKRLRVEDLFDGRLEEFGISERPQSKPSRVRELTDGRNALFVYEDEKGCVGSFTRYGANAPGRILAAIAVVFDTYIVSEHQPQYWGFDTNEEWEAWQEQMAREGRDRLYADMIRFVRGEQHGLVPGTNGMLMAGIAKRLLAEQPELMADERKEELLDAVDAIFKRDHTVTMTLTDWEISEFERGKLAYQPLKFRQPSHR